MTQEWPLILGIDAVAVALIVGDRGFRADGSGVQLVDPRMLSRLIGQVHGVEMRTVGRGHPMFGPACDLIRAEALVRIDCRAAASDAGCWRSASAPSSASTHATARNC